MTANEFSAALASLGWSQRHLARLLDCDIVTVHRWTRGSPIPPSIDKWLTRLTTCHERHPPPDDWRVYYEE